MNIIFFGNTKYSTIVAQALFERYGLSSVVTSGDRPVGRQKELTPNPVRQFTTSNQIPVIITDKLDATIVSQLKKSAPDFLVVADYGLILPKELLKVPRYAALNVHHSLLPKYRGPSPAPSAILAGEAVSGVTIIRMTEKVDSGNILAQQEYALTPAETTDSLLTQLNKLGGQLIISVIDSFVKGVVKSIPQDEKKATFTRRLTKQDGFIDLDNPPKPEMLDRMIRGYYPWPTVWTQLRIRNQELRIKFLPNNKLQVESGKPMSYKDFINGYPETRQIFGALGLLERL